MQIERFKRTSDAFGSGRARAGRFDQKYLQCTHTYVHTHGRLCPVLVVIVYCNIVHLSRSRGKCVAMRDRERTTSRLITRKRRGKSRTYRACTRRFHMLAAERG